MHHTVLEHWKHPKLKLWNIERRFEVMAWAVLLIFSILPCMLKGLVGQSLLRPRNRLPLLGPVTDVLRENLKLQKMANRR
jgi:hypothetical protein